MMRSNAPNRCSCLPPNRYFTSATWTIQAPQAAISMEQVRQAIQGEDAQLIIISAQTEADIAELETYEEKQMFLEDLGLKESGCNRLIKSHLQPAEPLKPLSPPAKWK